MIYQPLDVEQEQREVAHTLESISRRRAVLFAQLMHQLTRADHECAIITGTHIKQLDAEIRFLELAQRR